ncbi:hypothetical protein [Ectothiorhodospira marina]|uniref:Uncharacterized protein n=1 Tax=Ectothiorhodospira marina TaxID=1396821 RepID=A0A1H7M1M7_9GAMM|nr:hypothetical protein [Ectothiorhodospira marina]SEL05170.1 hypothetical protein SAMN05444515_108108 [Ectothiorhodospira marina]
MQLEAIYRSGRIHFTTPVRLKHHDIRVRIEIPDEEIESAPQPPEAEAPRTTASSFIEELKAIQAPIRDLLQSPENT